MSDFDDYIDGQTRSGGWDLGADEGVPGTPPSTKPRFLTRREVDPS